MKKIKDERLVLRNLQNIRIAYMIQTIGIIGILGYDLVTKGLDGMRENPLWLVFMVTAVISAYLSMNISVDHEDSDKKPQRGFLLALSIIFIISLAVSLLVGMSEGSTMIEGVIIGGVIFFCGLAPAGYIFWLRKRREEE